MKHKSLKNIFEKYTSTEIIDTLEPYVSEKRKQRIVAVIKNRLHSIQLAIEAPADINNALACVRTAEAFGISNVHIITPEADAKYARGITQGAIYWVDVHFYESFAIFLKHIEKQNLALAGGIMQAKNSISEVAVKTPICILIGNEQRGLSDEALAASDILFQIPMVGMSESLNLSVSAAISIFSMSSRKRNLLQQNGDLSTQQQQTLIAKYYLNSVSRRLIENLL